MTKKELVNLMAAKSEMTKKLAGEMLEVVLESIKDGVEQDGKVALVGFGAFEKRVRAERKGRNPSTGEEMTIPATNTVAFKASKNLKELVNAQ